MLPGLSDKNNRPGTQLSGTYRGKRLNHVQGFTQEIPNEPILFPKTPNSLLEPEAPIVLPYFSTPMALVKSGPIMRQNLLSLLKTGVKTSRREKRWITFLALPVLTM
jgi:hypothetical protein